MLEHPPSGRPLRAFPAFDRRAQWVRRARLSMRSGHVAAAGWARARGFFPTSERTRSNRPQTEPAVVWSARARLVCAELPPPRSPATSAAHRCTQCVNWTADFQALLLRNALSISTGVGRLLPVTRRRPFGPTVRLSPTAVASAGHGSPSGARQRGSAASDACIYVVFEAGATQASRPSRPRRESRSSGRPSPFFSIFLASTSIFLPPTASSEPLCRPHR